MSELFAPSTRTLWKFNSHRKPHASPATRATNRYEANIENICDTRLLNEELSTIPETHELSQCLSQVEKETDQTEEDLPSFLPNLRA